MLNFLDLQLSIQSIKMAFLFFFFQLIFELFHQFVVPCVKKNKKKYYVFFFLFLLPFCFFLFWFFTWFLFLHFLLIFWEMKRKRRFITKFCTGFSIEELMLLYFFVVESTWIRSVYSLFLSFILSFHSFILFFSVLF